MVIVVAIYYDPSLDPSSPNLSSSNHASPWAPSQPPPPTLEDVRQPPGQSTGVTWPSARSRRSGNFPWTLLLLLLLPFYVLYRPPVLLIRAFQRRWPDVLWEVP